MPCQAPCLSFMMALCWLGPRHVAAACHVGSSTNLTSSNGSTASLVGKLCQTSISALLTFIAQVPKNTTNETTALRVFSASTVFWKKQCHYCRIVINIWLESGLGVAVVVMSHIEHLCAQQLKVNGNPVKTLRPIKMDDAEWVIFPSSLSRIQ